MESQTEGSEITDEGTLSINAQDLVFYTVPCELPVGRPVNEPVQVF